MGRAGQKRGPAQALVWRDPHPPSASVSLPHLDRAGLGPRASLRRPLRRPSPSPPRSSASPSRAFAPPRSPMARPEDLKDDLVLEISRRLPCRLDRASMAATCRTWEAALTREAAAALLRQLPVLFFPKAEGPSFSCLSCGGALHDLALLPYGITGARLIGSRPSSWWFAATGFLNGHVLSNTATGQQIQVPDSMRFGRGDKIIVVQILAANVSAIPNDQVPAALCYGAALVKRGAFPDVMFWRLHQQIGLSSRSVAFDWARRAADVIHHNGVFKFLTQDERLVFVVPEITDGDLELHADVWAPAVDVPGVEPLEKHIGIDARYLVVSRGELLMLRRYRVMKWWTESFRVYRLERLHLGQSPEEDHYTWVELTELGGRILFVARGCSIAFEVQDFAEYPAAVEGVYFKGDVDEFTDGWCAMETLERATMLSDCGRWSFPRNNDPCFEIPDQVDGTFEHSAAAWLFL